MIDQKPDDYPGGIEYHLLDIVNIFIGRQMPVYILFPEKDSLCLRLYKDYRMEEFRYSGRILNDHRLGDADIETIFNKIMDDINVDLVHFQSIRTLPLSLIEVAKKRKKSVVITLHEYYFWCINCIMLAPDFCWFEKDENKCFNCLSMSNYNVYKGYSTERRQYINYLFQLIDKVIVPSSYVREIMLGLYEGLPADKCMVIENGIDKKLLQEGRKQRNTSPIGRLKLAFLGNFLPYKGNRAFIEILKFYKNSDSVDFSIVGNIFDPSLIPSYSNLNVIGGYKRGDVVKFIKKTDPDFILLLSNWPETFSYTLSEAIASGTPVIATDAGALRERVSKEGVGFLVPVESPVKRTVEIIEDLKNYPEVSEFLRDEALHAQKRLMTVDKMVEITFQLYNSL